MKNLTFKVELAFDDEAGVYYVQDSDVPGLAAEADTVDHLIEKIKRLVPELVSLNSHKLDNGSSVAANICFSQQSQIPLHAACA